MTGVQTCALPISNILVVDDELGIRDLLSEILNDEGHQVELAENAAQARAARGRSRGDPTNYFKISNPAELPDQMGKAFRSAVLAAVAIFWPAVIGWPLGVVATWLALNFGARAWRLRRRFKRRLAELDDEA